MGTYINTKDVLGEQATLDALIDHSLTDYTDSDIFQLGNYAFYNNDQIETITLPYLQQIRNNSFDSCINLKQLRVSLELNSVCNLSGNGGISNIGRCIIFVPPNLVSQYRNASNWSQYAYRIYGDGDQSAPIWNESEIIDSDSDIISRINNGTACNYYKPGQYKSIDFGSLGMLRMQIIGFNSDELSDGTGTAQLTWLLMDDLGTRRMNPQANNNYDEGTGAIGGWDKSEMKSYLYNDVWPTIPNEWKNVIKEVKKYSRIIDSSNTITNNVLSYEKIWLPSVRELLNNNPSSYETIGAQYNLCFAHDQTRIKNNSIYWTRSINNRNNFYEIASNGSVAYNSSEREHHFYFGFCT